MSYLTSIFFIFLLVNITYIISKNKTPSQFFSILKVVRQNVKFDERDSSSRKTDQCDARFGFKLGTRFEPELRVQFLGRSVMFAGVHIDEFVLVQAEHVFEQRRRKSRPEISRIDAQFCDLDRVLSRFNRDKANQPPVVIQTVARTGQILDHLDRLITRWDLIEADQLGLDRISVSLNLEHLLGQLIICRLNLA